MCTFAHSELDFNRNYDKETIQLMHETHKMVLCHFYTAGMRCSQECQFAHGQRELGKPKKGFRNPDNRAHCDAFGYWFSDYSGAPPTATIGQWGEDCEDWQIFKSSPGGWRATKRDGEGHQWYWSWVPPITEQPHTLAQHRDRLRDLSQQRDGEFEDMVHLRAPAETATSPEQQQGAEKQQPNGAERTLAATVTTRTWPKKEILEADLRHKIVERIVSEQVTQRKKEEEQRKQEEEQRKQEEKQPSPGVSALQPQQPNGAERISAATVTTWTGPKTKNEILEAGQQNNIPIVEEKESWPEPNGPPPSGAGNASSADPQRKQKEDPQRKEEKEDPQGNTIRADPQPKKKEEQRKQEEKQPSPSPQPLPKEIPTLLFVWVALAQCCNTICTWLQGERRG